MASDSIKKALQESKELERMRSGEDMIPPPNYDIAMCLYERNADGSDSDQPFLSFGFRPQDFATNQHMKYQRFGVLKHHEREGKTFVACFLVHLYWDGSRDEDSARDLILASGMFSYGEWQPTAPSDPLRPDDGWDSRLGEPPNGFWDDWYEQEVGESTFKSFNNFERPPYEKVEF